MIALQPSITTCALSPPGHEREEFKSHVFASKFGHHFGVLPTFGPSVCIRAPNADLVYQAISTQTIAVDFGWTRRSFQVFFDSFHLGHELVVFDKLRVMGTHCFWTHGWPQVQIHDVE